MKFILYKNAKHLRAESTDGPIRSRLRALFDRPKRNFGGIAVAAALVGTFFGATPAMAAENNIVDTTNPVSNEQVVDYDSMQAENDAIIADAVAQAQDVNLGQENVQTSSVFENQTAPGINETIDSRVPQVDNAAPIEVANDTETNLSVSAAEEQETEKVSENDEINNSQIDTGSTTEVTDNTVSDSTVNTIENEVTTGINEEIDSRVPRVDTGNDIEVTDNTEINSSVDTEEQETEKVSENDEINNSQIDTGSTTEVTDNTVSDSTVNTIENEVTTGINEEIDSRVPRVDTGNDIEVTDNTEINSSVDTEEQETEKVSENDELNNSQIDTGSETVDENLENIQENEGYQIIEQDGSLFIIGDIPEDQLDQIVEDLTNKYGEDVVNNSNVFDYDTINSQINPGETGNLGNSGYTASKDADGNIVVRDANGNEVYNWNSIKQDTQENIKEETNGPVYIVGYETQNSENMTGEPNITEKHDYIIAENEDGSITIINDQKLTEEAKQKVIDFLTSINKITENTIINEAILPHISSEDLVNNGQSELAVKIGDYIFKTKDGKIFEVYDENGELIKNINLNNNISNDNEAINDETEKSDTFNEYHGTETNGPVYIVGYETQNSENMTGEPNITEKHDYIIAENEDGSITIINDQKLTEEAKQKVIDFLTSINKITENTIINEAILPHISSEDLVNNGQSELAVKIGDYIFKTKDGEIFEVYDENGELINTITKVAQNIDKKPNDNTQDDNKNDYNDNQNSTENNNENKIETNTNNKLENEKKNTFKIANYNLNKKSSMSLPNTGDTSIQSAILTLGAASVLLGAGGLELAKQKRKQH